jgi:mono/diheme cytochrome c family protein
MQPALVGSRVVSGDLATLIKVVLHGPAQVLPADRPKYQVQMPPFAPAFSDEDIAATLMFVRNAFGGRIPELITPAQVNSQR